MATPIGLIKPEAKVVQTAAPGEFIDVAAASVSYIQVP